MTEQFAQQSGDPQEICTENGIRFSAKCSPKFRSCLLTLHFYVQRTAETAPVHALLTDLLTASSADEPDIAAMSLRLESLYAADFSAKLSLFGDCAGLIFTASWLDDRFALNGEAVTDAMLELVLGCLLRPNAANGAFRDPEFRICKQNLLDDIDCMQNDKRSYALKQAAAHAYCNEPAAIPAHGSRKYAEAVTAEQAFRLWQEILQTAPVDIVCITPEPKPQIAERLLDALQSCRHMPVQPVAFTSPSPPKPEPQTVAEDVDAGQSKLVLIYKYRAIPREVLAVLCGMLGGISESLLFTNIREKQGLCYYCVLQNSVYKHALVIDSGMDPAQADAVRLAADAQIDALKSGDFTDEMMEQAILQFEYQAAAAQDAPDSMAAVEAARFRRSDPRDAAALADAMRQVTRTQIAEAAMQLVPDTVYLLRAAEGEGADPDAG